MPLTDKIASAAKPKEKPYRLTDERGMYLEVTPRGGRYWRFKYRFAGKEKRLALGVYPDTTLAGAREQREAARKLLASGIDPAQVRKTDKRIRASNNTFESVAREWFEGQAPRWAPSHASKVIGRLEREIFPWLGAKAIDQITAPQLLESLSRVERRGHYETAHRTLQAVSRVFRYAIASGKAERDPGADLTAALKPVASKNLASVTEPRKVAELLRALYGYSGHFPTACALKLAPMLFVRPGELRTAQWHEFDLDVAEWLIPSEKKNMKSALLVPLARQAVTVLIELRPLSGMGRYLFPGVARHSRPMSENTVTGALRRLGYESGQMTGYGFRNMASTLLKAQGWNPDAIERQLGHAGGSNLGAAGSVAEYLPERRKMMQAWADYLDSLRLAC
jgi:integrase